MDIDNNDDDDQKDNDDDEKEDRFLILDHNLTPYKVDPFKIILVKLPVY